MLEKRLTFKPHINNQNQVKNPFSEKQQTNNAYYFFIKQIYDKFYSKIFYSSRHFQIYYHPDR